MCAALSLDTGVAEAEKRIIVQELLVGGGGQMEFVLAAVSTFKAASV